MKINIVNRLLGKIEEILLFLVVVITVWSLSDLNDTVQILEDKVTVLEQTVTKLEK